VVNEQAIPHALVARSQWIVWRYLVTRPDEKPRKVPCAPTTGGFASSTNPATWGTWEEALAAYRRGGWEGVGYVFAADDSMAGIDLDNCIDAATGAIMPWAQAIIEAFDSYTERSPSGRGVHILIQGTMPGGKGRKCGPYEAYSQGRYFTVTGDWLSETPATIEPRQSELERFLATRLPERQPASSAQSEKQGHHQPMEHALDDDALLAKMWRAKNGAKVEALWNGDVSGHPSRSDADFALCAHLAWWTNGDGDRIDRLFRRSGLMREKWDERRGEQTYGERTISGALDGFGGGYADEPGTTNSRGERGPSLATQLVALACDTVLFHDGDQGTWTSIPVGTHWETWPLHSKSFKRWLARRLYMQEGRTPSAQAMQDALNVLDGKAMYDGPEMPVYVRLAEHAGAIYLDLADEEWRAIRITAAGWQVMSSNTLPVKFRRPKGMFPLSMPVQGGALDDLRAFVNVSSEEEWQLLIAWLLGALRPSGPFPVLGLNGEMGSAKTTLARALRSLVDPNAAPVRAEPKELRDLAIAAKNSWTIVLDNLSSVPTWLSDGLCRLSTGGGSAYRMLYENDEEAIFDAQRPIILTGIEEVATRGDLVDRAILLTLPTIPDAKRRPESAFWKDFERARPGILGALLDAISGALLREPQTLLATLPRMADFAVWVTAAERTLGWESGRFLKTYMANRAGANFLALESSPVAERLIAFMEQRASWDDTPTRLYEALSPTASAPGAGETLPHGWPKSARVLSSALMRLAPNLRRVGVAVTHYRDSNAKRTRKIRIAKEATQEQLSEDRGDVASDASSTSDELASAENKSTEELRPSDAPSDAQETSDVQWTHPHPHPGPGIEPIWTHLEAQDAQLWAHSLLPPVTSGTPSAGSPFCPRCCRTSDVLRWYTDEDGSRPELRCIECDVPAEWASRGA
jgi:primase/DNA polymerase family protein